MMAGKGGSAKLDVGVLSAEQQDKLRQFKIKTRIDNEIYLRSHPEVEILISDFLSYARDEDEKNTPDDCRKDVLLKRPADVREFAADHFTSTNLHVVIGSKMEGNSDVE